MLKKKQADFIRPVSMDFPCWLYVFALCSILPTDVHCQCGNPGPGRCNANNSQFISDREVVSPSALSCPFLGSLCNYRQGCRDKNMSTWTAGEGYSQASQKSTATCGAMTYSVLESRWIQFSIPVCLQFSFRRYSPVALAVFFEPYPTGSTEVIPLLAKERNTFLVGQIQEVNVTINKTTGKVLFRIFGGAPGTNTVLKLYPVSYQDGRCETPAPSSTQEDQKTSDVAAIGVGVAAAVIVIIIIAVIIIVIVLRKRRRFKKDGDKRTTMAVDTERGNGTATAAEQRDSDDYSKIPTSHFAPATPHEDNGYSDLDGATSHPQNGDVDPYELIQDDAPGKTRPSSGEDDYNHIGMLARVTSHEVGDDDYHHIHSPHQAIPEPEDSYVYYPERGTENNAAQPVLGYTYTQVNKQRGGDRTMEVDPDSSNVYTKVNKKAKQKPGLAPKPSQPKGEGDPYNIIHRSSHPEQRGQNISERDDVDDEYNMLNFEDSRDGVVKPSGTAIGSYDHVRDAPDAYSKADGGKPHIVIDSGYDHLHLVDV